MIEDARSGLTIEFPLKRHACDMRQLFHNFDKQFFEIELRVYWSSPNSYMRYGALIRQIPIPWQIRCNHVLSRQVAYVSIDEGAKVEKGRINTPHDLKPKR